MFRKCLIFLLVLVLSVLFAFGENRSSPDLFKYGQIRLSDPNANKIGIFDRRDSKNVLFSIDIQIDNNGYINQESIENIQKAVVKECSKNLALRKYLVYQWADKDQKYISEPKSFKFESETDNSVVPPDTRPSNNNSQPPPTNMDKKNNACSQIIREIASKATEFQVKKYTVLIFDENLNLYYENRSYGVVGDLIFVGIIYKDLMNPSIEFSPCSLEPEMPTLYIGDTSALSLRQVDEYKTHLFPPHRCFNSSVNIKIKAKALDLDLHEKDIEGYYPLSQYNRYRGTLQMGVLYTDQHDVAFGLKTENDKKFIYNKGPVDKGPEYTASLVIYSIFRYVENIFSAKKHFSGRDIINDRTLIDSVGAVIGVGLTNPGNRFVLGISLEVAYGINLTGVVEFARLSKLGAGLTEGAEYSGSDETIPILHCWDNKLVFGLSLDLRYVTALFSRK